MPWGVESRICGNTNDLLNSYIYGVAGKFRSNFEEPDLEEESLASSNESDKRLVCDFMYPDHGPVWYDWKPIDLLIGIYSGNLERICDYDEWS